MPSQALDEIRRRLGRRDFRFCATFDTHQTFYEILVRLPDQRRPDGEPLILLAPQKSNFLSERSQVWNLACCWDALDWDVPVWIASLGAGSGLGFGDKNLCSELKLMVRSASGVVEE